MEYILILFSFVVHVLTFIILRHYRGLIDRLQVSQSEVAQEKKEIEELLAVYLVEMREENDRLIEQLKINQINQQDHKTKHKQSRAETMNEPVPDTKIKENQQKQNVTPVKKPTDETSTEPSYQPLSDSIDMNDQPMFKKSFEAEVMERYQRGESVASIARALDRGKTEVELTIKFQK